jgi:HSP20 family protein
LQAEVQDLLVSEVMEMIRRKEKKEGLVPADYWGPNWMNPMTVMRDMDRLFDDFRSEWENAFMYPRTSAADIVRQPLVDLADNGKEYVVKAELPGISKEDLNIEVSENAIDISAESKEEKKEEWKGYIRRERRYASFFRSIPLPEDVLPDKANAELKEGVLTVTLPKASPPEK